VHRPRGACDNTVGACFEKVKIVKGARATTYPAIPSLDGFEPATNGDITRLLTPFSCPHTLFFTS
jgi:hypothetical protein